MGDAQETPHRSPTPRGDILCHERDVSNNAAIRHGQGSDGVIRHQALVGFFQASQLPTALDRGMRRHTGQCMLWQLGRQQ